MSAHDNLPRTQFGDVQFPGEVTHLRLQYRHHVHEYPHSPGGSPEKLGRALYRVTILGNFQDRFAAYPGLYPDGMNTMRGYAVAGLTLTLTHPTVGRFPAFITSWDQVKDAKIRSGEKVEIEFLEDQSAQFLVDTSFNANHVAALGPSAAQIASDLAAIQADLNLTQNDVSIFDAFQVAVNSVLAIQDTADQYGNRLNAGIVQVIGLCQQLDALQSMQDARCWPVIDGIRELNAIAVHVQNDLQQNSVKLMDWTVPFTQSLIQIAITLYGDASRQSDLLSLNAVDDPMNVPAGFDIRYYPLTTQEIAAAS
jgi:hypothetical protein